MEKREALKLRPGQHIVFGNSMWSAKSDYWRGGTVVSVTPRGGIRVRPDEGGALIWVPYHHVFQGAGLGDLGASLATPPAPVR